MTTKFTLMSDLHADFLQKSIDYSLLEEDVVVAGDTTNGLECLRFLGHKLRNKGHNVFSTPGNHEHYANLRQERDVYETEARFREEFPATTELSDGTPITLRTGWYPVTNEEYWRGYMNDSRNINVGAAEMNALAEFDAAAIRDTLNSWRDRDLKGVVVTHMAPCIETLDPRFEGQASNEWYWNPLLRPLLEIFSDQIHVWCHGHTHAASDKIIDGVRVVCNPRGYPGENPGWSPITIEI